MRRLPMVASATSSSLLDNPVRTRQSPVRMKRGIAMSEGVDALKQRLTEERQRQHVGGDQQTDGREAQRDPHGDRRART